MHWSKIGKVKDEWHWWLKLATGSIPLATGPRKVTFVRYCHQFLDEGDNLGGSYKFVRDLLQPLKIDRGFYGPKTRKAGQMWIRETGGVGLITGDGPGQAEFTYEQIKVSRKTPQYTTIIIQDIL